MQVNINALNELQIIGIPPVMPFWIKLFLFIRHLFKKYMDNINQVYGILFDFISVRHKYWSRKSDKII